MQVPNRNYESIHKDFKELIIALGIWNKRAHLVGILTRRIGARNEILGRAFSMNNRVKEFCKILNVGYIDMWHLLE